MEEIINRIDDNIPQGYAYKIYSSKNHTHVTILRYAEIVMSNREDNMYWALKHVDNYFLSIKQLTTNV